MRSKKSHCLRGHLRSPENLNKGGACKQCYKELCRTTHCKRGHIRTDETVHTNGRCKICPKDPNTALRREMRHKEYVKRPEVKERIKQYHKEYHLRTKNADDAIMKRRNYALIRQYGITLQDYMALREAQDNKCAVCGRDQLELDKVLCVDHDHKTGKVRGLLCHSCNGRVIPIVEHLKALIPRAEEYLGRTS